MAKFLIRMEHEETQVSASVGPYASRKDAIEAMDKLHPNVRQSGHVWVEPFYDPVDVARAVVDFLHEARTRQLLQSR